RVLQLVELGVLDRDEGILGEDVLDVSGYEHRSAEQAGIVETQDAGRLVRAVAQLEQGGTGIQRNGILHARDAAYLVEHVVGQWNRISNVLGCGVHDQDGSTELM